MVHASVVPHVSRERDLQPLVGEVSWSHNLIILSKCKDTAERAFYLYTARRERWSKSTLIRQIEAGLYRRTRTSQTNFGAVLPPDRHPQAELVVKDEYVLDFLTLTDQHSERELESAIMANLERFLREMGGAFTFVGRQYPLRVNDTEYFVDLLFYHRWLKSLVAVELKTGAFRPEFIGKMQFYLALLDDTIRVEDERPSMGIILCKTRDKTIVEYALRESRKPIGVAGYRMVSTLPQELRDQFPGPDQIARLLDGVSDIQSVSAVPTTTLGHPSP